MNKALPQSLSTYLQQELGITRAAFSLLENIPVSTLRDRWNTERGKKSIKDAVFVRKFKGDLSWQPLSKQPKTSQKHGVNLLGRFENLFSAPEEFIGAWNTTVECQTISVGLELAEIAGIELKVLNGLQYQRLSRQRIISNDERTRKERQNHNRCLYNLKINSRAFCRLIFITGECWANTDWRRVSIYS